MVQPSSRTFWRSALYSWALIVLAACGSQLNGTYTNQNGLAMVELRSDGKATTSLMGESHECTYKHDGRTIHLDCDGTGSDFRLNDDGSLTGPGFMGVLTKAKK